MLYNVQLKVLTLIWQALSCHVQLMLPALFTTDANQLAHPVSAYPTVWHSIRNDAAYDSLLLCNIPNFLSVLI